MSEAVIPSPARTSMRLIKPNGTRVACNWQPIRVAGRCVQAYYLQQTRFENIAQRKLRRRQLTDDGNVEISGRDLR